MDKDLWKQTLLSIKTTRVQCYWRNGRGSSSKQECHIDVQYNFAKNRIASKEIRVEYCPTGTMMADNFTKPLQGALFIKFCDLIMNYRSDPA